MLSKFIFLDNNNMNNTVLLVGTGRSGTTWVEDIINCDNDFRIMFEPFNTNYVGVLSEWKHRQYIPVGEIDEKFKRPAEKILSGKIRNNWIDRFNEKFFAKRRLVKDIRIHACLNWVKEEFSQIPIVYLMRHPCAVAKSKEALKWHSDLSHYTSQALLVHDFLSPFMGFIEEAKTPFQQHIVLWCIENYLVMKQFKEGEILVTFYEDLCLTPNQEAKRIFEFLDMNPKNLNTVINKPSALSAEHSAIKLGKKDLIGGWQKKISDEEILFYKKSMQTFNLDKIYNELMSPLISPEDALGLLK